MREAAPEHPQRDQALLVRAVWRRVQLEDRTQPARQAAAPQGVQLPLPTLRAGLPRAAQAEQAHRTGTRSGAVVIWGQLQQILVQGQIHHWQTVMDNSNPGTDTPLADSHGQF